MKNIYFNSIVEKVRKKEISDDEALVLLNTLKEQSETSSGLLQRENNIISDEKDTDSLQLEAIAIIGMAGQFPDADDVDAFWQNLMQNRDSVHELPSQYLDQSRYFSSEKQSGKSYCKWGGILEERECFDPLFFNISPREAESMNLHQRGILQEGWKALEDAGYNPKSLANTQVGVFIGSEPTGYFYKSFTGSSDAIIASRLSYYLNLNGPALVVNTGCSSSGVAIHLACESLRNNESSMALAGGVVANLNQSGLVTLSEIEMLSPTGKCHTFDEAADGTVLSEGVGIVVLKRLCDAIADGDYIYGVIRGSGINQDGASNGITAPNGLAQEDLVTSVYKRYGINPEDISYIEAHGTGTKLGDPVEANALVRAFKQFTNKEQYCAIGSVKSNIGHTGAAAGVIGLIKIVLSLRHHKIPALINLKKLNPLIDFNGSAFFVNTEELEWKSKNNKPLMAGLNSFGHSGTNVHLVIQEYIPSGVVPRTQKILSESNPVLIPISAKNIERLEDYADKILDFLKKQIINEDLTPIAYTLQIGREAMEERVIFLVNNISELITELESFIEGKSESNNCWRGQVKQGKNATRFFAADEDMQDTMMKWIIEGKSRKIAEMWSMGFKVNWELLYEEKPSRISLPAYPFSKERFSITKSDSKDYTTLADAASIHPLLHQNTSDFLVQRFSSTFTGREIFFEDHIVKGELVLPGVAYLEMTREAVKQAIGVFEDGRTVIRFKNVVWMRPIVVENHPVQVNIRLFPEDNGEIAYEIYSESVAGTSGNVIHNQGSALISSKSEAQTLDLHALQSQCNRGSLTPNQCYEIFKAMGLDYGPGHRGIEMVYMGKDQVLAKLALPVCVSGTEDQFVLNPSLMDSALQASIGLMVGSREMEISALNKPFMPFALQELEVIEKCSAAMWALVRYSDGSKPEDKVQKLDIDLCDRQGRVCVRMKGFSSRVLEVDSFVSEANFGLLMLEPCWKEETIAEDIPVPVYSQHVVILCEMGKDIEKSIASQMDEVRLLSLQSDEDGIAERFGCCATKVFEEIQDILKHKPQGNVLVQVVISSQKEQQFFSAFSGLLKTAQLENSKLIGQLIEVESGTDRTKIIGILRENSRSPLAKQISYRSGKRWVAGLSEVIVSQEATNLLWKDQGVYLITGGASGLGFLFAKEIVDKVREATIILTGRSLLSSAKQEQLKALATKGVRIEYKQADVTDKKAVERLIQGIRDEFGSLNGIIHSAGVNRDNFIIKKTIAELVEVLAPKVTGLVNLDQASQTINLDFFILFSSMSGKLGNPGQADYSAANAFMDAYAKYNNELVASNQRRSRMLSINWPLWQDGGMHVDAEVEKLMKRNLGMIAMRTSTGIQAMGSAFATSKDQVIVAEGNVAFMKQRLLSISSLATSEIKKIVPDPLTTLNSSTLLEKVQLALMQSVFKLLNVKMGDIDVHTELNEYGFDSITFTEFANQLNREYRLELMPTIFFEHSTIHSFAKYLVEEHYDTLAVQFAAPSKVEIRVGVMEYETEEKSVLKQSSRVSRSAALSDVKHGENFSDQIAIVGISGRFPGARDVNEFWLNLLEGKDCITEIPKDRWDWQEYYGDPSKEANKTNVKWGGFIEGIDEFDPLFFGISPREAELMDPQQRLMMLYIWKAIEDGGISASTLSGTKTGIFVGTASVGYSELVAQAKLNIEGYSSTGIVPSVGPNRMSYFLNIHGPSEPIETACSSSLVAIHRAVNAILDGSCEMAIVGGVNTILTPHTYISFNKAGMLCEDGRCKTFSNQANGYVRGEGVGMLLLKKLKDAEQAGDHIYGIIRGTAENHGGRATSLTAPNPKAQAELLVTAYTKAGIDPRTVSYIEAHGTGTELGDPIEINGLKTAFKELYQATGDSQIAANHCGLGSVKTNVGHLELAAGIAGVIKVLLQLKHKTLVKSLHCDTINPYIQLQESPFYIVRETKEWEALRAPNGQELPRRVGVSSFGFGGVNAHVVIEEYIPRNQGRSLALVTPANPAIIVLSAKNEDRLKEQVQQLLNAIREQRFVDNDLADIAYTLQIGREAMEERLALLVGSIGELEESLKGIVENRDGLENLYRGNIKHNKEDMAAFSADEDMAKMIDAWINKRKYRKLMDIWVKGISFDWDKLYGDIKPRRTRLPTYPFDRGRYWIPKNNIQPVKNQAATISTMKDLLHPLLQQNTSDLSAQRFSSIFTGQESFLADHIVRGQRVLPGVAYLEMARAAVVQATGFLEDSNTVIGLKNIVWICPIIAGNEQVQVHIELIPEENGEIAFKIYSENHEPRTEKVVHSQGSAVLSLPREIPTMNLQALQTKCNQRSLTPDQCYEAFHALGIEYGPRHQGIENVYIGKGHVLAKLALPTSVSDTLCQYVLHPSIMDSALQALIVLMTDFGGVESHVTNKPFLPFALQELEILGNCTSAMWALIGISDSSRKGDIVQKFDIDLCNEQGTICVRMKGLSVRMLEGNKLLSIAPNAVPVECINELPIGTTMLTPVWDIAKLEKGHSFPLGTDQVIMFGGNEGNKGVIRKLYPKVQFLEMESSDTVEEIIKKMEVWNSINHIIWIAPHQSLNTLSDDTLIHAQNQGVLQVFRIIKALLHLNYHTRELGWTVITIGTQSVQKSDVVNSTHASLHGLIGSLAKEYSNWKVRLVDLEEHGDWPLPEIFTLATDSQGESLAYRDGEWYQQKLISVHNTLPGRTLYKSGGVYVVIGGAGGIGEVWSEYMIRTYQAKIIWIGRRPKDTTIQEKLDNLAVLGSAPIYIAADATKREALQQAYKDIKKQFPEIHGVIHSAIVLLDQKLANMDEERFQAALAAKVDVSVRIAQVFSQESLDFILFFSSMQSFSKSLGQSNYASGCTFKDAFARQLTQELPCAVKVINWGYWGSIGIVASQMYQERMAQVGIGSIEASKAMKVLETLLTSPLDQIALIEITKPLSMNCMNKDEKITVYLEDINTSVESMQDSDTTSMEIGEVAGILFNKVQGVLKEIVANLLKVKSKDIDTCAEFVEYGFDPVMLIELANQLNQEYHLELTPAIIFEQSTIYRLAEYLVQGKQDIFIKQLVQDSEDTEAMQMSPFLEKSKINLVDCPQIQSIKSEITEPMKEINELLCKLLWGQLQLMGKNSNIADFKIKTGLRDLYDRWFEASIEILVKNHYLTYDGQNYSISNKTPVDNEKTWEEWDQKKIQWLGNPNFQSQIILLEATLRALPDILTGKRLATDVMFPNSSMSLVEGIYKNNLVADYFNQVLADTVTVYIERRIKLDPSTQIRIIEIGAGTGATSTVMFRKLAPYRQYIQEYCYTDISKVFLLHAEKEYGSANPYLNCQIFNVEHPVAGQGIQMGRYDLLIATNVMHATKNIRQTLRNAKATLKKNGLILLNEISRNSLFAHLTFGLLEGWWLHEDTTLRIPGCPGLASDAWQSILRHEGFRSIFFPVKAAHDLGQQIIIGNSDGIVRQKQEPTLGAMPVKQNIVEIQTHVKDKNLEKVKNSALSKANTINERVDITDQMIEEEVKLTIIEKLAETLKVDSNAIDVSESFSDYGLDSITGVHLVQVINQTLKIELQTTIIFDYSSVNQLARYILSQHKDAVVKVLGRNIKPADDVDVASLIAATEKKQPIGLFSKRILKNNMLPVSSNIHPENEFLGGAVEKDSIAIVGMSGRFAKSKTVKELWEHLANGTDLVGEVTRWDISKHFPEGTSYCNHGSFLEDIDQFDPLFFNISGLEATYMDPQQRLFLEEAWKSLEDAGYAGTGIDGRQCGVYLGCGGGDYQRLFEDNPPPQSFWGNTGSVTPARIAYYMNLQGPAIAIDTACSSSLVAIHLACQGLWTGEIEMAIAGGVFIQCTPWFYLVSNRAGMLSPTGKCHAFDERADGFVPGEGVGVVVLKRLKDAIADGDHIYGVIRGSGINQDGTSNGITAPSARSQERLEHQVYETFNIHPEEIQMVEAHGTGTILGDPIEFNALTRAFRKDTDKKEYCAIGSIKTNLGHAATTAGVTGLIKILLSLQYKQIPPSLHFLSGNSNIQFHDSPFYVNTNLKNWDSGPNKRCAAVSSFGFSGTNAHMVIEEAPVLERRHGEKPGYLVVLSARTFRQLQQQVEQLLYFCRQEPQVDCGNMSYTLLLGRKHCNHRLASVVRNTDELVAVLKNWLKKGKTLQTYVAELRETERREQPALKHYGNQCIQNCRSILPANDYLEQLAAVAELYIQGYQLEFEQLFVKGQYSRISLPTYPFARERYWVSTRKTETEESSLLLSSDTEFDSEFYNQLIDEIKNDSISVDAAVRKIKNIK